MKNFIIYLPAYQSSVDMASRAVASATEHGWTVELYAGVDGKLVEWTDVQPCSKDAKCRTMMDRPGVRGCFLSHWQLWNLCVTLDQPIGIFEHDIVFCAEPPEDLNFDHLLKLEGFLRKKARPAGEWYEGARAYIIKPAGASRLISWVCDNGALPADVAIGVDVVDIALDHKERIVPHALYGKSLKRDKSFTWNLEEMT